MSERLLQLLDLPRVRIFIDQKYYWGAIGRQTAYESEEGYELIADESGEYRLFDPQFSCCRRFSSRSAVIAWIDSHTGYRVFKNVDSIWIDRIFLVDEAGRNHLLTRDEFAAIRSESQP